MIRSQTPAPAKENRLGAHEIVIRNVCDAIIAPSGEQFLRLLRDVYRGVACAHPAADTDRLVEQATLLDVLREQSGQLFLTEIGYLVGNVAKEYCNWIDHDRRMPPPRPFESFITGKDILDIGCSFGRWLWEFQTTANSVMGLERQWEYIELGRALALREGIPVPDMRCGSAEELESHVPTCSVDLAFSRLMFNHVKIKHTLRKVATVLRPGGVVWLQVEPLSAPLKDLLRGERRLRSRAFAAFGVLNSFACMFTGRQLELRIPGRMHEVHKPAYPTIMWWKTALRAAGLTDVHVAPDCAQGVAFYARRPS